MTTRFHPGNAFPETPGNVSTTKSGNARKPETPETHTAETRRNPRTCVSTNIRKRSETTHANPLKTFNYQFPFPLERERSWKRSPLTSPNGATKCSVEVLGIPANEMERFAALAPAAASSQHLLQ